jgi:hypothetical protein
VINDPRYRRILRSMFSAIMQSDLSATDLNRLAEELRRGRLSDELGYMIHEVNRHFYDPSISGDVMKQVHAAERLIREKRIAKAAVINILHSIAPELVTDNRMAIRGILQEFFLSAGAQQSKKLLDVLAATGNLDPYHKGISETRSR